MSSTREVLRSTMQIAVAAVLLVGLAACGEESPRTFKSPEAAIEALTAALADSDGDAGEALFGPGSLEVLRSGDPVADKQDIARTLELIRAGVTYEDIDDHTKVASFGPDQWPFAFPLVSDGGKWHFDLEAGIEELHSRRIGRNELSTLATLHAYVDAQREYFRARPLGDPPVFAQRFRSEEDTRNGLYWPTAEGEELSPLGDLVAQAADEGYANLGARGDKAASDASAEGKEPEGEEPEGEDPGSYHGYHYRILTGQGEHVPSGARSYIDAEGRMRTGFAAVAWPASYGNSGIMTFQVNHWGMVFQKDLGDATATAAAAITVYDPDETWEPTGD